VRADGAGGGGNFCVIVGLVAGYLVWGERASALALSLDRLSLEYDAVRARAGATSGSLASTLEALSGSVRQQGETLAQQTEALTRLMGAQDDDRTASLRECDDVQVKIQEQLDLLVRSLGSARSSRKQAAPAQGTERSPASRCRESSGAYQAPADDRTTRIVATSPPGAQPTRLTPSQQRCKTVVQVLHR
jgi:hypothetical protein